MIRAVLTPEQMRENELHAAWTAGRMSGRLEALTESANNRAEWHDGVARPTEPSINPYQKHEGATWLMFRAARDRSDPRVVSSTDRTFTHVMFYPALATVSAAGHWATIGTQRLRLAYRFRTK